MDRVPTGIDGLDELIEGGFPRRRVILVTGACGTGKTIFSAQYIYRGAVDYDEPGIYVTLEQFPREFREDMLQFGWDFRNLEEQGLVRIIDASVARIGVASEEEHALPETGFSLDKLLVEIIKAAKEMDAKRIAIDSIPAMGFRYEREYEVRNAVLKLSYVLKKIGLTGVLTSETGEKGGLSKYGVEEYVTDGVIILRYGSVGGRLMRSLQVRKMRGTKHSEHIHPVEISRERGIVVYPIEEV